jgi:hypothetical protein
VSHRCERDERPAAPILRLRQELRAFREGVAPPIDETDARATADLRSLTGCATMGG